MKLIGYHQRLLGHQLGSLKINKEKKLKFMLLFPFICILQNHDAGSM